MSPRTIEPTWSDGRSIIWFVLSSLFTLFAYGIDVDRFLIYNLFYSDIVSHPVKYADLPLSLIAENFPISLFHRALSAILLVPVFNAFAAVSLSVAALWIGLLALKTQSKVQDPYLIVLIVAVVAHGFFPGLDSSSLIFDRKAVAAFLLITVVYSLARNNLGLYFVCAVLGTVIHPLVMLSGLAFLLPGYALYSYSKGLASLIRFCGFTLLFLAFVLLVRPATDLEQYGSYSLADWYHLSLLLEVGDVALFDMLWKSIGVTGFLIIVSTSIAIHNRSNLRLIDYWALTFAPILILFLCLEGIQASGLTFGTITEFFVSLQFRRGLWLASILALAHVLLFVFSQSKTRRVSERVELVVVICAVLIHSLSVIILAAFVLFGTQLKNMGAKGGWFIGVGILFLTVQLYTQLDQLSFYGEMQKLVLFAVLSVAGFFLMRKSVQIPTLMVISIYSGVILANNNYRHDLFDNSWSRVDHYDKDLRKQILASVSHDANEELRDQIDLLQTLNRQTADPDDKVLFSSAVLGYAGPILSDKQFIFSRWDNTLMFDRAIAGRFVQSLRDFDVDWKTCRERRNEGTACVLNQIQHRIEQLSEDDLSDLANSYDVRFVVRKTPLQIQPIVEDGELKIYDLSLLKE